MMVNDKNVQLTSAELMQLWNSYQNDSLSICVFRYFLNHVEDADIRPMVQHALNLSQSHIPQITAFFQEAENVIPQGFTEDDINETAPRLYSDTFILTYLQQMGSLGINAYSIAVNLAVRSDVYDYFATCLKESVALLKGANELLLSKGLYIRPPSVPKQDQVSFVDSNDFLQGWFGKRRPLLSLEITNLYDNIQRNAFGVTTLIGFAQVASNKDVIDYMIRGKDIATKHVDVLGSLLKDDHLPVPVSSGPSITESVVSPFSDKLMMFLTTALVGISVGYYGTSMATSLRTDISMRYIRLSAEIGKYSLDGAKLMIKNRWMEQPPMAIDRDELAKHKVDRK